MWLSSWWVAWFNEFLSILIQTAWNFMELQGHTFHEIAWHSMELHRYSMEVRGTSWHSMELDRYSMELHGTSWHFMELHPYSMELRGYSMELLVSSMEVFHTGGGANFAGKALLTHYYLWYLCNSGSTQSTAIHLPQNPSFLCGSEFSQFWDPKSVFLKL